MLTFCLEEYLKEKHEVIESHLDYLLPQSEGPNKQLYEAARYSVLGGGKRIRPILALTTAEMFETQSNLSLTPACAIELIHAYSLIHDDLPCMDDDDYRRGKLTVHRCFNEGLAVLTGDFLLTYAFELISNDESLSDSVKNRLIRLLAKRSGGEGMVGGQVIDISSEHTPLSLEEISLLHIKKTGALLRTSLEFGAIISDATEDEISSLALFGEKIGLAFQIVDDILDVVASEKKHGKKIASDIKNEKSTFVTLLGLKQAQSYAENYLKEAIEILKKLPYNTLPLESIAYYIVNRKD